MAKNKNQMRQALGRGLSNLIPVISEDAAESENEIHYVDIEAIKPNPFQPRTEFDTEEIQGLADSIKNQGLLQPIVLRKSGSTYEIISGERRFRAMKVLAYDKVPCIVKMQASDREMLELALVENVQRENLNDMEKAHAFHKLLTECGFSHEELSKRIGKDRTVVTNTLRLLKLPQQIQDLVSKNKISMGHARAILSIPEEKEQLELAQKIITDSLSVRDVEAITKGKKEPKQKTVEKAVAKSEQMDPDTQQVIERLRFKFGTDVYIHGHNGSKGSINLAFYTRDDMLRIVDILLINS